VYLQAKKKEHLAELYKINYGVEPNRNIRTVNPTEIPDHDILCAGFPCQPFSKAGKQDGLLDEVNGSFFDIIVDILAEKQTKYFILENVRNIESHDDFKTWGYIEDKLKSLGYNIAKQVMSPHQYNIPQHRERLFIIGSKQSLAGFSWPEKVELRHTVKDYLDKEYISFIDHQRKHAISVWQKFVDSLPKDKPIPGFPIWSMEFGANYPIDRPISELTDQELENYRGSYGISLSGMSYEEKLKNLPSYAVKNKKRLVYPSWKIRWIKANRDLWSNNKDILTPVVEMIKSLPVPSWKKFEWNCGEGNRDLSNYIIQFRASGVRIKRADFFPSLVTVSTQIPIIGWQGRYLTPAEGARIQSFGPIELPDSIGVCFGALGNAVNVKLVELIAERLLGYNEVINMPEEILNELHKAS